MTIFHGTHFDREFSSICHEFVKMSKLVEEAISQAMIALCDRDLELAHEIIINDAEINKMRFKIEEDCLTLIATQQPTAGDLRAVIAVIHMVLEIERMGDHAAGIAKTVVMMEHEPLLKTLKKIPRMGELSRQMLADCVQAFLNRNAERAREIALQDVIMDQLYKNVFDKLIEIMAKKPELVTRATYLMWCAHNLERIADRVTNIAEQIDFMITGQMRDITT